MANPKNHTGLKSLDVVAASPMVHDIVDERDTRDGIWVYLVPGFNFDGVHCVHEDTVAAIKSAFKDVEACDPDCDCLAEGSFLSPY
jgi:hypothetical protein